MEPDREVTHDVLRAIRQIVRRISQYSRYLSREVGLTVPQLICLKAVGELEQGEREATIAQVSKQVHLSPATVSRVVHRLVVADLVARERQAQDRRKVCLSLTPAGQARFRSLPVPLQEEFVERLMKLAAGERLALLGSLQRISELMGAAELDAAPLLAPGYDVKTDPSPSA